MTPESGQGPPGSELSCGPCHHSNLTSCLPALLALQLPSLPAGLLTHQARSFPKGFAFVVPSIEALPSHFREALLPLAPLSYCFLYIHFLPVSSFEILLKFWFRNIYFKQAEIKWSSLSHM